MAFEFGEKQVATTIVLATLTITAGFTASGVTRLMASSWLPLEGTASGDAAGGKATGGGESAPGSDPPDIKAILARNMFDPETGALWPPKVEEPVDGSEDGENPEAGAELAAGAMPPACEGKLKMVASVYAPNRPEWSFVSVNTGTGDPLLYRLGSTVDGKLVDAIYPKAVFLKSGTGLCSLVMFEPPPAAGAAKSTPTSKVATTAAKAKNPKASKLAPDELDKNIEKVSDTKYNVQRELVDKLLSNQAELMRAARVVPHEQNGQVVGVKLYGIRRKSLLGKLGLQNGDLLRTVNGFDMASPDSALQAYSKLRDASALSVAVTRRGRAMNIDYNVSK